jgi:uncharacterized protein
MLFPAPSLSDAQLALAAQQAGAEELRLQTSRGDTVYGWHLDGGGQKAVIYAHGNAAYAGDRGYLYQELRSHGWDVIVVSYPGYPGSDGRPSEAGIHASMQEFWRYSTDTLGIPADHTVLHGLSLGGGAVGTVLGEVEPAGIVLECTFTSVIDMARRRAPIYPLSLLVTSPFQTVERAPQARAPVLMFHGTGDGLIPVEQGRTLKTAFPHAELVEIDRAPHGELIGPGSAEMDRYLAFLEAAVP